MSQPRRHRSALPWLFGLAALLAILSPLIFVGVWVGDDILTALAAAVADLVAAAVVAVVAGVLAVQRGVRTVRTVVQGHPQGRAGRMADYHRARWSIAKDRFAALQRDYAAFEADPRAIAARPALADVTVPATARFVEAYGDAQFLLTEHEPAGPRREEFAAAVDRAVDAWERARSVAEGLAAGASPPEARGPRETRAVEAPRPSSEYSDAAQAVRRAAVRGAKDLRERLRA